MVIGTGRRQFISALGGAVVAWPFTVRGQQLPTVGFMGANASAFTPWTAAFVERLRELGWIEGRTVHIEYRWSEGRPERTAEAHRHAGIGVAVGEKCPILERFHHALSPFKSIFGQQQ
jgi:hypothetical protein